MGGSGWSATKLIQTNAGPKLFVKTARLNDLSMFRGEALGLEALRSTNTIRIPTVYGYGTFTAPESSFIVMEGLDIKRLGDQYELGRQLALMHLAPVPEGTQFGFNLNNTIGATPQINTWKESWIEFWIECRLRPQLKMAGDSRLNKLADTLIPKLDQLFEGIVVVPSLIHGDLWSGNIGSVDGQPVIFDPATYYGHHEAEFGMSWCAGFTSDFWRGYRELIPKDPGFDARHKLYQLYHYLNHYNLFGDSYFSECASQMTDLIDKVT